MTRRRVHAEARRFWSPDEDARLRMLYPDTPTARIAAELGRSLSATYGRAALLGLAKSAEYLASPAAGRTDGQRGFSTRFGNGRPPANKGLKRPPGWAPGRMKDTQFRKGERQGVAVALYKPIGSERMSRDGYLERKISDALPSAGASRAENARVVARRWRAVHLLLWEAAHGPLPRGHAIAFANGDKSDIRLDNLELLTRQELMRRNSVHNLPAPLPQVVQLLGALTRKINRSRQHEEQDRGSQESPVRDAGVARGQGQADGDRPREGDRGRGARPRGLGESGSGVPRGDGEARGHGVHHAPQRGARITPSARGGQRAHALVTAAPSYAAAGGGIA